MTFSLETIKVNAKDEKSFQTGKELFKNKKVRLDSVQSFWKGEFTVQGSVAGVDGVHSAQMVLRENKMQSWSCSCQKGGKHLCSHLVAISLDYLQLKQKNTNSFQASTSPALQTVLEQYTRQRITSIMEQEGRGNICLEPQFQCTREMVSITFKIGNQKRSYVLKDLQAFYYRMKSAETASYGKNFQFVHSIGAFQKENRPFVQAVLDTIEESLDYYRIYNPYRSAESLHMKELNLTKANMDRFFELLKGERISIQAADSYKSDMLVLFENPKLTITLEENLAGGFDFAFPQSFTTIDGEKRIYILMHGTIYCCNEDFSKAMGSFCREFGRRKFQDSGYTISRRDMVLFCGQFLPQAKPFICFEAEDINLDEFTPKPVKAVFSLDVNEEKAVTCEEKLVYEDFSFNPAVGGSVPIGICRDLPGEFKIRSVMEKYFKNPVSDTGLQIICHENEIYRFLEEGVQELLTLGEVYVSEAFKGLKAEAPRVSVGVSVKGNLLELKIDTGAFSKEDFLKLLESYKLKKKFYRLKTGEFLPLEDPVWETLADLEGGLALSSAELSKETVTLPAYRALYLEQTARGKENFFQKDSAFQSLIRFLEEKKEYSYEVPAPLESVLRSYQKDGFRWLSVLEELKFGGILADEMGLGKTVQIIAFLLSKKKCLKKPAIIICPASLVYNWENEFRQFAPEMETLVIAGNGIERMELIERVEHFSVWITSYDLLKRDIELYQNIDFSYEIIDEAQVIKNHLTQSAKAVKALQAQTCFALTGTPIENRLSELWSIFDYLMPGYLFSYSRFKDEFEQPIVRDQDERVMLRLRKMIKPFVLRRCKHDVLKDLPDKLETVVYSKMTGKQRELYTANAARLREELFEGLDRTGNMQILAALTRLRQICCDPSLCYENYEGESAKLETCMELITEAVEAGHKLLLFSQFTSMLDIIRKRLDAVQISSYLLTGMTKKKERVWMAEQFNQDRIPVFLISLKAGGTGLNLTGADIVIHFDPWWNIAAQNQATDRAHRIGQKKEVSVFKLVAKDSIEENILRLQESKRFLAEQIINVNENSISSVTMEELLELLD